MKKLFLTSGIIACMACPAFATPTAYTGDATGFSAGQGGTTVDNSCVIGVLGTATNGDTSNMEAQWTPQYHRIVLDVNSANGAASGTTVNPTPLWSEHGTSGVYTSRTGTDDTNYVFSGFKNNASGVMLTDIPAGKEVQYSFNYTANIPAGHNESEVTPATSTNPARAFKGFYTAATDGNQVIDATGTLTNTATTGGEATAAGYSYVQGGDNANSSTWYAQYNCATPVVEEPELTGYVFNGWKNGSGADVTPGCLTDNETLYATWRKDTFHISYNCGHKPGNENATATVVSAITTQDVQYDSGFELYAGTNCQLQGYTFAGWSCDHLTGTTQQNGYYASALTGTYTYAGDTSCTAMWTPNTINLTYDGAGGTPSADTGSCEYDNSVSVPSANRTGYTFNGWQVVSLGQ